MPMYGEIGWPPWQKLTVEAGAVLAYRLSCRLVYTSYVVHIFVSLTSKPAKPRKVPSDPGLLTALNNLLPTGYALHRSSILHAHGTSLPCQPLVPIRLPRLTIRQVCRISCKASPCLRFINPATKYPAKQSPAPVVSFKGRSSLAACR